MVYLIFFIGAFLLGGFPTGVVLSRRKYGIDVREMGSGNIGATNITRVFGWYAGVLTFVIDLLKGYLPLLFIERYSVDPWLLTAAGAGLVVGHCYSPYLKFQGGKGVATSLGCLLAVAPWCAGLAALVYLVLLVVTKISAVGSLGGMFAALLYVGITRPPAHVISLVVIVAVVVLFRHKSNIRRLLEGGKKGSQKMRAVWLLFALVLPSSEVLEASGIFSEDAAKTMAAARKEKKPVIIDFFGIWCPPCNELDETVFETAPFLEKAKAFKLLKVDADAKASWKIKDRYKVGGYPTIVFTDPRGEEVYRLVGYRALPEFLRAMDLVRAVKGSDLSKACKSGGVEDLWRCASICAERKDVKCAESAFAKLQKKLTPASARYHEARGYFVEEEKSADLKRDGYERLLRELPESPKALLWALGYLDGFQEGKEPKPNKGLVEKVLAQYPAMAADPRRDELGLSVTDMPQLKAALLEKLGQRDEARAAWKEAAAALEKAASELLKEAPARGFTLQRIYCLEQAGDADGALKLANEYRAKFPKEFTFHHQAASLLQRLKRYNDALPVAKQAFEASYGDNRIRVATLLIELYATVPDKAAAKQVYDEVTKERPEASLEVRTHRYLKRLEETFKKHFPS